MSHYECFQKEYLMFVKVATQHSGHISDSRYIKNMTAYSSLKKSWEQN